MSAKQGRLKRAAWGAVALLAAALAVLEVGKPETPPASPSRPAELSLIVQAKALSRAAAAVRDVGGRPTRDLGIIDAVAAALTPEQAQRVARVCAECRLYPDRETRLMASGWPPDTAFPTLIGAALLHLEGVTGQGINVAVIDSGLLAVSQYLKNGAGSTRVKAQYNAFTKSARTKNFTTDDAYGHGSHVTGITASSMKTSLGLYHGVAPDAGLISVKAFDENGGSTYATVIQALDWVVSNKDKHKIRVLNASFGAPVASWYWDDPMNQAIMKAWQAGIVVVASAGNTGPSAMTIQAPGNVPYVISVGAMTDNYTPLVGEDDYLASFSAAGPTYEAHVKPDLVAPGGHDISWIQRTSGLGVQFPQYFMDTTSGYYQLSGTSQAAAVVSGVAALMLQADPTLSPDDVKCGLMATAQAGRKADGSIPYSVFQQGAGLVKAWAAVHEGRTGCANSGLDIDADLAGTQHFGGPASQDANGNYYLADQAGDGTSWSGAYTTTGGYPWSSGYPWSNGYPWANGYPWTSGYPWSNGYPWANSAAGYNSPAGAGGRSESGPVIPPLDSGVDVVRPGVQQ